MDLSRRSSSLAPAFIPVLVALLASTHPLALATTAAAADSARITAVANVTIRSQPSASAPVVAQLPLGTEVIEAGPSGLDKTWLRVRLADTREGWVQASLTRPLDPLWRWPVFDRIVSERLGRRGDGFSAQTELVAFIERVSPEYTDVDGRARMELARLRAMGAALGAIPFRGGTREPYASWLSARKADVIYDEPGGRWMLAPAPLWDLHTRHATTSSADDLAWFAVTNGLAGECEGHLPCYVVWRDRLLGEYLRRHPAGRRATESVAEIGKTMERLAAPAQPRSGYTFDKNADCRALTPAVDALIGAVKGTHVEGRDAALSGLAGIRRLCG